MSISKKRIDEINAISDDSIDTSDIPELDDNFWRNAKLVMPKPKKAISLRIDDEVYEWFKSQGDGYQSRINAILKSYMDAHISH